MDGFHRRLVTREVSAQRVSARPFVGDLTSSADGCSGAGVHLFSSTGLPTLEEQLPFQVAFAKERCGGNLLAAAGEGGRVQLYDTSKPPPEPSIAYGTGSAVDTWQAHSNSIFDIAWLQNDTHLVTASGDQMIRLWNLEAQRCVKELRGHQGSVKSVCIQPTQNNCLASGGRDGAIMLWDLRTAVRATRPSGRVYLRCDPVANVKNAHPSPSHVQKRRTSKDAAAGVTSVLYLKDDTIIASSGHADGVIKYWDTRKLHGPLVQTPQLTSADSPDAPARIHGIVCLAQDSTGGRLIASSRNNHIYMYDTLSPQRGPFRSFTGHQSQSFYTKATFSPDDSHIVSGSTDNHVYIWEADRPQHGPFVLEGHGGEVTGVDWCKTDFTNVATCSDDCTVRVWTIQRSQESADGRMTSTTMRKRVYSGRLAAISPQAPESKPSKPPAEEMGARTVEAGAVNVAAGHANTELGGGVVAEAGEERKPDSTCGAGQKLQKGPNLEPGPRTSREDAPGCSGREEILEAKPALDLERASEKRGGEEVQLCTWTKKGVCEGFAERGLAQQVGGRLHDRQAERNVLKAGDRERKTEEGEMEPLQVTPEKELPAEPTFLMVGDGLDAGPSPSTPVNGVGVANGRLRSDASPSGDFAFWNTEESANPLPSNNPLGGEGGQLPLSSHPAVKLLKSHNKSAGNANESALGRLGKALPNRLVSRPPLSPTRVNVQHKGIARKLPGLAFDALGEQRENVSPVRKGDAVGAMGLDAFESPSSVLVSPTGSSRKRQRTIVDYFKSP